MRITPFSEIAELEDDQLIMSVQGKIVSLYQPKSGTNDHGPWKFQTIELVDKGGNKIKVKLKNRRDGEDVPTAWKGKEIIIESTRGEKGFNGLYAFDDEYQGKTSRMLKVTATASVYLAGDASRGGQVHEHDQDLPAQPAAASKPAPRQQPQETEPPAQRPAPATTPAPAAGNGHTNHNTAAPGDAAFKAARQRLMQRANLYTLCIGATMNGVAPAFEAHTGGEIGEDHFQAAVGTLFIAMDRAGEWTHMPTSPLPLPAPRNTTT